MKRLVEIAMMLVWLGAGAYSQEAPELGFFAEEPAVKFLDLYVLLGYPNQGC